MTVKELIEILNKVENKEKKIAFELACKNKQEEYGRPLELSDEVIELANGLWFTNKEVIRSA